jgi:hypothetical protein
MYVGLNVQHPLVLSDLHETWIFWTHFPENLKYYFSWKSVHWEPSCSVRIDRRIDRQADMTKLSVVFRYFAKKAPKSIVPDYSFPTLVPHKIYLFAQEWKRDFQRKGICVLSWLWAWRASGLCDKLQSEHGEATPRSEFTGRTVQKKTKTGSTPVFKAQSPAKCGQLFVQYVLNKMELCLVLTSI